MRVVVKRVDDVYGKILDIDNKLEVYQELVGGSIETYHLRENLVIVLDEEGKLKNKDVNFTIQLPQDLFEYIVGDIVIVSYDSSSGDFTDLSDKEIRFLMASGLLATE